MLRTSDAGVDVDSTSLWWKGNAVKDQSPPPPPHPPASSSIEDRPEDGDMWGRGSVKMFPSPKI
ncbi:hypothetical protein E2562_034225 [Oryza meyeriana var. granulata]|uniref:Uncharacterized protein n=1 Tax=Oryza meyeriana var. granulata TaxID=110450 RepID=A0A6G1CBI0_9ORYZ|nr:hypothetical protein E2562_034225 [Oryza meyeriana var. granulata]